MSPSRRNSITKGLLSMLLSGEEAGETINTVVTKLYKKSEFDLDRAQRGVVFLDGLDKLCNNTDRNGDDNAKKQVFEEIFKVVSGTMINVSRLVDRGMSVEEARNKLLEVPNQNKSFENCGEFLDTSNMFFVGFGGPPDGFERASEKQKEQNKKVSPNDPRLHSPASGAVSLIENDKDGSGERKLSSGHYSGDSNYSGRQTPTRTNRQQQQGTKEGKKEPGDGPGGGEKRKDSGYGGSGVTRPKKQYDDFYEDDGYGDDYYDDDDDSIEDEEAKQLSRLLEVCETDLYEADSKFKECQKLWGMQDIEFEFEDGALETIATQAMYQQTGENGISNILEKLFMTIKFDIPSPQYGKRVAKIRVSEAAVIGTKRPIYYFTDSYTRQTSVDSGLDLISQSRKSSSVISETSSIKSNSSKRSIHSNSSSSSSSSSASYYHKNISANLAPIREEAKSIPKSYEYSEFDLEMLENMEM